VLAGRRGGVRIVIQQPPGRGAGVRGIAGRGQRAGVLTEQVVQAVAAAGGLGQQVLIVQAIQVAAGGG